MSFLGESLRPKEKRRLLSSPGSATSPRYAYVAKEERPVFGNDRELRANFFSRVTWTWLNSLISFGHEQPLEMEDLAPLSPCDESAELQRRWDGNWAEEVQRRKPSVIRCLRRTLGFKIFLGGVCKLIGDLLGFMGPILLHAIVQYVGEGERGPFNGYGTTLALTMFTCSMLQSLFIHQHNHLVIREAIHARTLTTTAVFRKILQLSPHGVQSVTSGRIVNYVASDSQGLQDAIFFLHYLWAAPLQIVITLLLAVHFLGPAALAGFGVMVVVVPLQSLLAAWLQRLSERALQCTDQRVGLVSEILQSIRTVKFYAWEEPWAAELTRVRDNELRFFLVRGLVQATNSLLLQSGPVLVSLTSFTVYALYAPEDEPLQATQVFTALALFNILRQPLSVLPYVITSTIQAYVSTGRLCEFYQMPELDPGGTRLPLERGLPLVHLRKASFVRWGDEGLCDVSLAVHTGDLVLVVGSVGSGKSTLVDGLLGEVPAAEPGTAEVRGRMAYVAQQPWIVHGSVRDNILMGKPFDETYYRKVVAACSLERDMEILVHGDMTMVGHSGVNLSGGQKSRISIARAVYSDADVYVFDDPLAALDAEVASAVFDAAICNLLEHKARILVTNKLELASVADEIMVLDRMRVVESGAFAELVGKPGGVLAGMLRDGGIVSYAASSCASVAGDDDGDGADDDGDGAELASGIAGKDGKKGRDAVEDESRNVGSVSTSVYVSYLRLCGLWGCALALLLTVLQQTATTASDWWMSVWTNHSDNGETLFYLRVYAQLSLGSVAVIAVGQAAIAIIALRGSRATHVKLLNSVIHAPVSFFDATPVGRLCNRFAADLGIVDRQLGVTFSGYVTNVVQILGSVCVQLMAAWWMVFPAGLIFALYRRLGEFFRCTSRELKRLDSVSKSPVFVHFGQTLGGLPSIRAYGLQAAFTRQMQNRLDCNNRAFWTANLSNRWLGVRLEGLGNLMLLTTAIAVIVSSNTGQVSVGVAGLVLSYSLSMTSALNTCVRNSITTETQLNAVERIEEYSALEREGADRVVSVDPPATWGSGAIEFRNVCARYRPELPLVLKNLSFRIEPGEKVGVVGRTGSGKSSTMLLLLRVFELESGGIYIDDVDISKVALTRLRRACSIIPQLPVLFTGTVRFNLDPFDEHSDAALWDALDEVGLRTAVDSLEDAVVEGGENFSVGQRQLFSLARAVLRQARILLLDEATASVDSATDSLVQTMIRSRFQRATTLTIAHRINTILDSDRVLVLGDGEVLEFDSPAALQSRPGGVFESLVRESGLAPAEEDD